MQSEVKVIFSKRDDLHRFNAAVGSDMLEREFVDHGVEDPEALKEFLTNAFTLNSKAFEQLLALKTSFAPFVLCSLITLSEEEKREIKAVRFHYNYSSLSLGIFDINKLEKLLEWVESQPKDEEGAIQISEWKWIHGNKEIENITSNGMYNSVLITAQPFYQKLQAIFGADTISCLPITDIDTGELQSDKVALSAPKITELPLYPTLYSKEDWESDLEYKQDDFWRYTTVLSKSCLQNMPTIALSKEVDATDGFNYFIAKREQFEQLEQLCPNVFWSYPILEEGSALHLEHVKVWQALLEVLEGSKGRIHR